MKSVCLTLKNQYWNFTVQICAIDKCVWPFRNDWMSRLQLNNFNKLFQADVVTWLAFSEFLIPSSTWNDNCTEQGNNFAWFSFLTPSFVSNQAIRSRDGSVRMASCLFVSADKGNAICGRWTLLTLAILWLFVRQWRQCDHGVRKINCQPAPPFLMLTGFSILFFFSSLSYFFSHHHLSTSNFKSDPNLNYRDASAWYGHQMLTRL